MANEPASPQRIDPYQNWKYQILWDGKVVAAASTVTGFHHTTQVTTHREGGDSSARVVAPGGATFGPITLGRGVTHDVAFEQWANKVWYYPGTAKPGSDVSLTDFRKDVQIALFNEAGQRVARFNVYRCWPSEFESMAELDGTGNAILFEKLTLQNEGWDRDLTLEAPAEPS